MKKAKIIPGNKSAMRCNEGKITIKVISKNIILEGWRPYLKFDNLRSNQTKNGSKAIKVKRNEKRHIEKVRNLGAKEKHKAANQRLR